MEVTLQRLPQLHARLDSHGIVMEVSELLKRYFLPVHVEVLCRGYRKQMGKDLPFREFGYSSPVEFLRDGCGNAFEVTQSQKDKSVFYVAAINSIPDSKSLTLKRESNQAVSSESHTTRKPLRTIINGSATVPQKKKSVPPQFRQYLRFLISRHPSGICAENLIAEFLKKSGSPLSYEMYGYPSHREMFEDLPDVFTIRMNDGEVVLYPSSIVESAPPANLASRTTVEPVLSSGSETSSSSACRVKPVSSCDRSRFSDVGKIELENGGSFVHVKLNGKYYVPTACLASLAGARSDTILRTLEAHNIEVQGVEVLRESVQEHEELRYEIALVNCPLVITKAGVLIKEISLVPLRSMAILLRIFHTGRIELENCFQNIQERFAQT